MRLLVIWSCGCGLAFAQLIQIAAGEVVDLHNACDDYCIRSLVVECDIFWVDTFRILQSSSFKLSPF